MGTEAVFHCNLAVVEDDTPRYTAKVLEYTNASPAGNAKGTKAS